MTVTPRHRAILATLGWVLGLVLASAPAAGQKDFDFDQQFSADTPEEVGPIMVVRAIPQRRFVQPGDQLAIAVRFTLSTGYHTWPSGKPIVVESIDWESLPTRITMDASDAVKFGQAQWPQPEVTVTRSVGTPTELPLYHGTQVAFVPIVIAPDAQPGELRLSGSFFFQACDESACLSPETEPISVTLTVVPEGAATDGAGSDSSAASPGELAARGPGGSVIGDETPQADRAELIDAAIFQDFDPSVFADPETWDLDEAASGVTRSFFGLTLPTGESFLGLIALAVLSMVGGFILNLTPCVLPVIPIKVMTISQHAGSPGKSLVLGLWMAAGVVAFWVGIGLPVAFVTSVTDPSRIFGIWWVTLGIGAIIGLMGVGIMGLFQIRLPEKVYMVNPKADTAYGSFVFGVMTAVLGLPCFGFVAGALLAGAATLPAMTIMIVFASLGVGMALPYVVLAAKPGWIEKIPRTGPASELVKQVMGLLLIAAAAFFVGAGVQAYIGGRPGMLAEMPWWGKVVHWWAIALMTTAAGVWLAGRTIKITRRIKPRVVFSTIGLVLAGLGIAVAMGMTHRAQSNFWLPYSEQTLADALADGKVVVIDFTADWCINCKVNEAMLEAQPVRGSLLARDVVPLQADNTSTSAPGWAKMRELGQTGIPLLVVYGPGLDEPWQANGFTPEMVVDAIERARGGSARAARSAGAPDAGEG